LSVRVMANKPQKMLKLLLLKLSAESLKEIDAIGRTVTDHLDDNPRHVELLKIVNLVLNAKTSICRVRIAHLTPINSA
jgi:hypothetical protein